MTGIGAPTSEHRTAMAARAWLIGVALTPPLLVLLFGFFLRGSAAGAPGPAAFDLLLIAVGVAGALGAVLAMLLSVLFESRALAPVRRIRLTLAELLA